MAKRMRQSWRDSFAAGCIGYDLPRIFNEYGLTEVRAEPQTLVLNDLALAGPVFDLHHLMERMQLAGELKPDQVKTIIDEFTERAGEGRFHLTYTGYLVWGKKPE